jgi:hypothetical protein
MWSERSDDRVGGTQQRHVLPEIFVSLRENPSLAADRNGIAPHPETRPRAIEGVERQHSRDGPVAVVRDAQDINPAVIALAVPAGEFGLQRRKGGVKSAFFPEREFRAPLLSDDL